MNEINPDATFNDINEFFKPEPTGDDLALAKEIIRLEKECDAMSDSLSEKQKDLNGKKKKLADSWSVKQISDITINGDTVSLCPVEKFSLFKKDDSEAVKQKKIENIKPLLQRYGIQDIVKVEKMSIHHLTFDSNMRNIFDQKGSIRADMEETLNEFKDISHYAGVTIKVSTKKVK